jgi:hypothetical protein
MFHWPLLTVNGVLVQAPWDCFGPSSTTKGPAAGVAAGAEPPLAAVVGVWVGGTDVPDAAPLLDADEVPPAEDSAGRGRDAVPPPPVEVADGEPPVGKQLPRSIPTTRVPTAATTSCQVLHDIRSLIFSSPGAIPSRGVSVPHSPPA